MKYLVLLAVLAVVLGVWRSRQPKSDTPAQPAAPPHTPPPPQDMVACAHCRLHLPRSEAVEDSAGRPYCSTAHRAQGPR